MHCTTKSVAVSFQKGLELAYGSKLARTAAKELYQMLDDMCLALAQEYLDQQDESCEKASNILASICDDLKLPVPRGEKK